MGTTIRPELSEKNPYWIEKHRYYELKHFCLQYPIWRKAYSVLDGYSNPPKDLASFVVTSTLGDPTAKCAMAKTYYSERTDMVERVAEQTDRELAEYILKAVTEGWSYDILKARLEIPCCKDVYYELYRRFFWLLNKERNDMKIVDKAVKKVYRFNCPNCQSRLEGESKEFEDIGGKISKFFCPVCKKDRYITWSDLRKKTVYEGENTQ